eukprot:TRINITY_DN19222_c0_g1_i2.p1 TRINITY_DN19222_c0_g1~~TRINITY_DN19222_c0_g1_i2.p1  ORF type:complete len:340 (-),score=116.65 TRINITY_DN19222_c0_g1_i2:517-1386(-)
MGENLRTFSELREDSSSHSRRAQPAVNAETNLSNCMENSQDSSQAHGSAACRLRLELDKEERSIMDLGKLISKADRMSEEVRVQRNTIRELEEENAKLVGCKEKVKQLKNECDFLAKENSKLQQELSITQSHIREIEEGHQTELEKLKHSFDEMDELLQHEKNSHKKEEEKLRDTISQLNSKLNEVYVDIENKGRSERMRNEKIDELKESNKKLKENLGSYKKRETNNKALLAKSKETIKELQLKNRELTDVIESTSLEKAQLQALLEHEKEKVFRVAITVECVTHKEE